MGTPVGGGVDAGKAHRLAELRAFLMSRRARVSPGEAGLPDGGARRRTPGLRREEVAVLAGVGVSWYQWLEQGRDITVSPQVLDSVARVLRLSGAERRHLYVLAGLNPPAPEVDPAHADMCDGLRRLLDGWMPYPAHIMDAYWNVVLCNEASTAVMGMEPDRRQNCVISFFTDPVHRIRYPGWEEIAARVVAQFRAACSECPDDEGFRAIVDEAKGRSPEFAELWERRDIAPGGQMRKELAHPVVGRLALEVTQLRIPARPDLAVVLHHPWPDTGTEEKLRWLASAEGRRGALRQVGA